MNVGYISPEDFQHFRVVNSNSLPEKKIEKDDNMCMFIIIGIIALIAFTMVGTTSQCERTIRKMPRFVSGYLSKIRETKRQIMNKNSVTSSKNGSVMSDVDQYVDHVAAKCDNLTFCKKGDPTCEDFKNVTHQYKYKKTAEVRDYFNNHHNVVVLIFAPWCPHCHTALPKFMAASDEMKKHRDVAIINAEMVDRELMGELQVTHFPYIFAEDRKNKRKVHKGKVSEEELIKFAKPDDDVKDDDVKEKKSVENVKAETNAVGAKAVTNSNSNTIQDPFKHLFQIG